MAPVAEFLLGLAEAELSKPQASGSESLVVPHRPQDVVAKVRHHATTAAPCIDAWKKLVCFAEGCDAFSRNLTSAVRVIGISKNWDFGGVVALMRNRIAALQDLFKICDCTRVLLPGVLSPEKYPEELRAWAAWSDSKGNDSSEAAEQPRPSLQTLMDATRAASSLSTSTAWQGLQHDRHRVVEFLSFSSSTVGKLVLGMFETKVSGFLKEAIACSFSAVVTECFSCQDAAIVQSSAAASSCLRDVARGERRGQCIVAFMECEVGNDGAVLSSAWPHHPAVDMANQFAILMCPAGEAKLRLDGGPLPHLSKPRGQGHTS